ASGNSTTGSLQGRAIYSTHVPVCSPLPTCSPTATSALTPRLSSTPVPVRFFSLLLIGWTSYMNVVAPGTSSLNITGAVTVEAWIKVAALTGNPQAIIERYGPSYSGDGGYALRLNAAGKLQFATVADSASADAVFGNTTITTG